MRRHFKLLRWIVLIGVLSSVLAAGLAFVVGAIELIGVARLVLMQPGGEASASIHLVQLMDTLLVGAALFLFSVGLYELFIGKLDMPPTLVISSLDDLKSKLAGVIVLVLAVEFLGHFEAWEDGREILQHAAAAMLVSAVLLLLVRTHK